ncbi:peroxide stress protein YaaA [Allosphingosinicella vermicomposti]|uniref:peroxide stress protein YaaA n=1 Tax=Allosphingosinicella vermicomposti TaxID=614671 RepID=UPI000D1083B0|nr:peroxide stress protein YaaA [Allosphingosinicella vermicomposti]
MLAVISPAKTLDYQSDIPAVAATQPAFRPDAERIAKSAARLSKKKLGELMHISDKLAELNVERFRTFEDQPERPAIYAFAGDVYAGFEVQSLDEAAVTFAQDHLRILSGLYGLLRPLDAIRPYRLEMGTRWAPAGGNLYGYWGTRVADALASALEESGGGPIINVASKEYWAVVHDRLPKDTPVIEIDFREEGPNGLRFNTFAAKRARGMVARYICEHRLTDAEALKGFDSDGYAFDPDGSDETRWRFTRR